MVTLDMSSEEGFVLSLAYAGVIRKHGSLEGFCDWIEDNLKGDRYDAAITVHNNLCEWAAEHEGIAGELRTTRKGTARRGRTGEHSI